jgi:AP2-associated kinase
VYLVRTAQPVYNTTHHVLKRIAVQNEAMLTEVKKEVDIMVRGKTPRWFSTPQ